jgi:hypothetical protein
MHKNFDHRSEAVGIYMPCPNRSAPGLTCRCLSSPMNEIEKFLRSVDAMGCSNATSWRPRKMYGIIVDTSGEMLEVGERQRDSRRIFGGFWLCEYAS